MRYLVTVDEREVRVAIEEPQSSALPQADVDGVKAPIDWRVVTAAARALAGGADTAGHYSLLLGATSYDIYARPLATPDDADEGALAYEVTVGARTFTVTLRDERTQALGRLAGGAHHSGDAAIRAPMPGLVSNVLAQEGQEVARGQAIVVLEAMKMENDLTTPRAGVVKRISVTKGQTVNQGETLAIIGDPAGAASDESAEESDTDLTD